MSFNVKKPKQTIRKPVLRIRPERKEFDKFVKAFRNFNDSLEPTKAEEFNKKIIADFLREAFYDPAHYSMNVKDAVDLAIHTGPSPDDPVGVVLEVKSPANKTEMISTSDLNRKALQEILLYFLRERFGQKPNLFLTNLIVTNGYEWFVFDASDFERHFSNNRSLVNQFKDFEGGRLSGKTTEFFYKEVASAAIQGLPSNFSFTYFNLQDFDLPTVEEGSKDEEKVLALYRLFSPENLLKLNVENTSNELNRGFYAELLHVMGLEEFRTSTKRLIRRKNSADRNPASLIESTILQLETLGKLERLTNPHQFGDTREEQLFSVALQLVLTWVNRVLFLKLLEAQLISFNGPGIIEPYVTPDVIKEFDDLNSLFFQVVARRQHERPEGLPPSFSKVPYLNSSLFQPSELEQECIVISNLRDHLTMPAAPGSVLRDDAGKVIKGEIDTLSYLLRFLNSYDFSSEGRGDIRKSDRPLITASVLGLIFEKINGYKDGAFFTPGIVTMDMARTIVQRAVLDKFKAAKNWDCDSLEALYDKIDDAEEAKRIIGSLRICDPAVGSGHFLVSILNEMIFVKSDLRLLQDCDGRRLKEYSVDIVDDELLITDEDGEPFFYKKSSKEGRRVQEAIFNEKRRIIENCIFGVDINPNSVNICRLRLWIELLKSSFYDDDEQVKTLPNIDINIQVGNSLVSRYPLDGSTTSSNSKLSAEAYRESILDYQEAASRDQRISAVTAIERLREKFAAEMRAQEPAVVLLKNLQGQRAALDAQNDLFETEDSQIDSERKKLEIDKRIGEAEATVAELDDLSKEERSFEWSYEFPKVLDHQGQFEGFDIVIGNPPYGVPVKGMARTYVEKTIGKVPDYEIYYWFINRARQLLRPGGILGFIIPNSILFNVGAKGYRASLLASWEILELLDCTDFAIFGDANVRNAVFIMRKGKGSGGLTFKNPKGRSDYSQLIEAPVRHASAALVSSLMDNWGQIVREPDPAIVQLITKLKNHPKICDDFEVSQGYIPYRLADLVKEYGATRGREIKDNREWHSPNKLSSQYIQELKGESLSRYSYKPSGTWVRYGPHLAGYVDPKFFNQKRVLVREITNPNVIATIVEDHFVNDPQIISIIAHKGVLQLEIIWAILTSGFGAFFHLNASPKATKGLFPKILVSDVKNFPLPSSPAATALAWVGAWAAAAVNAARSSNDVNLKRIERRIDLAVCRLYGLNDNETALVLSP